MGRKKKKLTSPKYAKKSSILRATVARLKGLGEPAPVVEEKVVVIAVPEPAAEPIAVEPEPAPAKPKAVKKKPAAKKSAPKKPAVKKPAAKQTTTKRAKRSSVKKDQ